MSLGIDLGTTRTVVAVTDHGNTPLVSFDGVDGDTLDAYPATLAWRGPSSTGCSCRRACLCQSSDSPSVCRCLSA